MVCCLIAVCQVNSMSRRLCSSLLFISWVACLLVVRGTIPRLSLNQHSFYVGVVENPPSPPLTGEQYGKMEPKYPEGGHCQSVLRPGFTCLLFL